MDAKAEVNSTALASVLGLTARRVQQLAQDGVIKAVGRGKYGLGESVQAYIGYVTREKGKDSADVAKLAAEVEIKKAKATVATLEAEELQGKMHRADDVAAMTEDLVYAVRGALMALPGRLAVDAAAISNPAEMAELIRREVNGIMRDLSQYGYDPKKYEERVRQRMNWGGNNHDGDDDDDG